ncbi:MAG: ExbD/TolR family protein [Sphingomonas oligoaromativorans]|jgi:biopolymer transport protein ExbD|uniref:ExbD/TolR family protein n=1 Tax=Sphingomonas oligoaromativorans TaxID=575322 RepID=UPI0014248573|nr:biopolymer transporter ExbD [Sphingomonas oligoaromativorans]NIJ34163.1 biopolymer transport protein ExbD [Sphingomonas oligoaromativorans]
MAMSVGAEGGDDVPMSDINTTPLVDVMLVLLIIFLITVPVVVQTVPLKLPNVRNEPTQTKPENVNLSVKADAAGTCEVYWGRQKVTSQELLDRSVAKLKAQVDKLGGPANVTPDNLPEAHIRGDVNTPYKCIGGTVTMLQRAGFLKVGFISEPPPGGNPRM